MRGIFSPEHTLYPEFGKCEEPWLVLSSLKETIIELGGRLGEDFNETSSCVWIHKNAKIAPTAYIGAPCIIGAGTEIRHCAFIRGSALIGEGCVVGNSTELKNVILFDGVQTPHYNYVGDSILGYKAHMGAGSITSNVKSDKTAVVLKNGNSKLNTGLKKLGALIGDFAEIGCNSVLNPGTVVGKNSTVYPLSCVRGVIPSDCILKSGGEITKKL